MNYGKIQTEALPIGNTLDRQALLAMAVDLEGHPDNVTPALMGG